MQADLLMTTVGLVLIAVGSGVACRSIFAQTADRRRTQFASALLSVGGVVLGLGLFVWHRRVGSELTMAICNPLGMSMLWIGLAGSAACLVGGVASRHRSSRPSPRRLRGARLIAIGLIVAMTGYVVRLVPRMETEGWVGAVPTWVLIAGLEQWPARAIFLSKSEDWITDERGRNPRDWTLKGRLTDQRLWEWQKAWLQLRLRAIVDAQPSVSGLSLTWAFVRELPVPSDEDVAAYTFRAQVSEDQQVRAAAIGYVRALVPGFKSAFGGCGWAWVRANAVKLAPRLMALLDDPDPFVASSAVETLSLCGDAAMPALPRLVAEATREPNGRIAVVSSWNLRRLASESNAARLTLVEMAQSGEVGVRLVAIDALVQSLWDRPDDQVRAIIRSLRNDPEREIRDLVTKYY